MMLAAPYDIISVLVSAPVVGSFLSVLITRLPRHEDVVFRPSHCPSCGHTLAPRDLLPVASFVLNRGACRFCNAAISHLYLAVELLALGVVLWALTATSGWLLAATCVLGWALLALAIMDIRELVLSDKLTLPLIGAGLVVAHLINPSSLWDHIAGAAAGFLIIAGLRVAYFRVRGREGLGLGDAKLLAAAGAWLSWEALGGVLLVGAIATLVAALVMKGAPDKLSAGTALPLGPGLALGFWLTWLYGPVVFV